MRQSLQLTSSAPHRQRVVVSECEGQPGRPYCKKLVLRGAQAKDTGYYRCYYKNVKVTIDGATAVSVYAFIRGESVATGSVIISAGYGLILGRNFSSVTKCI